MPTVEATLSPRSVGDLTLETVAEPQYEVYIAYNPADGVWNSAIESEFGQRGVKYFNPWSPEHSVWGRDRLASLSAVFPFQCKAALIFVSLAYARSPYCLQELRVLAHAAEIGPGSALLLPLRLENALLPPPIDRLGILEYRPGQESALVETVAKSVRAWWVTTAHDRELSNADLLDKVQRTSDAGAFRELGRRWYPSVLAVLQNELGDAEAAVRAGAEVYDHLYRTLNKRDPNGRRPVVMWVRSAVDEVVTGWKRRRDQSGSSPSAALDDPWERAAWVLGLNLDLATREALARFASTLPVEDKKLFTMQFLQSAGENDIASELNVPREVVSIRLNRLLRQLRAQLPRAV